MKLSPSARINLKAEIADKLAPNEWDYIDLALEEFGLPTESVWGAGQRSYCLKMLKDASDETLVDMGKHFGSSFLPDTSSTVAPLPSFWAMGSLKLFVSHLAANKQYATALQEHLAKFGVSCFVAHKDIEPTRDWQTEIETALATCDALVALLHPGFHESKWTDQEIGYAMGRRAPVFAVRLGADPYGFIGKFQGFNGNGKTPEDVGTELFQAYLAHEQTRTLMAPILVRLFEQSGSFDSARSRMALLNQITVWDASFNDRLRNAYRDNSQIRHNWHIREDDIERLIEKWSGSASVAEAEDISF